MQLYLASSSPRRFELLSQLQLEFSVLPCSIAEERKSGEMPIDMVTRLALEKAQAGWRCSYRKLNKPVLGADTIVVLENEIFGKPKDRNDAIKMLSCLAGCTHQVLSAISIVQNEKQAVRLSMNKVSFKNLNELEIEAYLNTGESMDKAGAYGVQGLAAAFISHIEGSYSGVMGLPLYETAELLRSFNINVLK